MASKATTDSAPARSIAETKLERQNKRIQEIDAAITNIVPADKRTQQPRGKKSKWQPLDLTDSTRTTTPNEGGVFVSEVRVNAFRAPSRGSSLSRPVSVLSHRTSDTGPSDMDRHDSALTDRGFQVFQRRRNRKNLGDLQAHEDKPEDRQTTVEATVDAREIYNVFGNALPGPEVIEANEGYVDGEVRFTQHPTGDVLAHQWSSSRYIWENIGQFSNHRERVEGQLAADRLKGETAAQSLQRNSLAYFRLIAKQREASVTGKPLGLKDIQVALPESNKELSAAPTRLKEVAPENVWATLQQTQPLTIRPQTALPQSRLTSELEPAVSHRPSSVLQGIPTGPRSERSNIAPSYTPYHARQEDPFFSVNSYEQIYGGYNPYSGAYYRQPAAHLQTVPPRATNAQPASLHHDFYFPQIAAKVQASHTCEIASPYLEVESFTRQGIEQWQQQMRSTQPAPAAAQNRPLYHTAGTIVSSNSSDTTTRPIPFQTYVDASRPKPATPLEDRSAMRDNLWKQADAAKERNLSQGSILSRTVLYDPLQSQSPYTKAGRADDPVKQDTSPTLNRGAPRKILQPSSSIDASFSRLWQAPVIPAPAQQITKPTSPVSTVLQNLHDSSPDPYPAKQAYTYQAPVINTPSKSQGTPQTFRGPFFAAASGVSTAPIDQKTYDEELNEWWTSGQKFARQEEFYRSITSSAARQSSNGPLANTSAHLTPIGQLSRTKPQEPSFNPTTTRLLIPILENLASYVQGPVEKRRDYFSRWTQPPEWCIDRSEGGNNSFFDKHWGTPPARVGRDPRYARSPWVDDRTPLRGRYGGSAGGASLGGSFGSGGGYVDRRFGFGSAGYYG